LFAIALFQISAQPVVKTDIAALLNELSAPPLTMADAYQRAYSGDATNPDAIRFYQDWTNKTERAGQEVQTLTQDFYRKYPTGIRPTPQPVAASRVTPQQQSSMDAATSELAQKMLSDPEFAKKFSQMSEKDQHAYIANLLAEKGLKPANGTPNVHNAPIPGTDVAWAEMCSAYTQSAMDMSRWEVQTALQQKYEARHQQVRDWAEAEIKKLPMISFGEYGHDHDPEQVSAVQKQALVKHRDIAEAMLKEAAGMFDQFRRQTLERIAPLNDALKQVNYGAAYDFGNYYTTVLGVQGMMIGDVQNMLTNEVNIINECARWEYELHHFK
ncbi:MAG TPA: hypothetical protein PK228_03495, partial [Saprospiraceae bacterium]|nr:hypothetical protein [Saprospiraceae bacterium]